MNLKAQDGSPVNMSDELSSIDLVRSLLIEALGLSDQSAALEEDSPILGAVPELDSMTVVSVLVAIEEACNITIHDEDVSAELFETLGSLARFVDEKVSG